MAWFVKTKKKWRGRAFAHHVFFVLISTPKWTKNSWHDSWNWTPMQCSCADF